MTNRAPYRISLATACVAVFVALPSSATCQTAVQDAATATTPVTFDKIKFKDGRGQHTYSIKPMSDGAKLVDAKENEVARYTLGNGKLKIKSPADETLGYIILAQPDLHIEDADQKERLWKLQRQSDGDWKLERRNDTLVYRIKQRDYGFEVETPQKKTVCKAKLKGSKLSLRDAREKTVYSTKDKCETLAIACLGLQAVEDERIRFGLAIAILTRQGN